MVFTIEQIMKGNQQVIDWYQTATQKWDAILKSTGTTNVTQLAKELGSKQLSFEHDCGGRSIGQEIMVIAGIARFYRITVGFEGNKQAVKNIVDAFEQSMCSIEVKGCAKEIAHHYGV